MLLSCGFPDKAHAPCRVTRCVQRCDILAAEAEYIAICQQTAGGVDAAGLRRSRLCARVLSQQTSAGDVVGMGVGF